jgi:hypothetical protein
MPIKLIDLLVVLPPKISRFHRKSQHEQRGHDQADQPVAACLCFPQRRLRVAVTAIDRLEVTMYAAFGKAGSLRKAPDALLPVCTNCIEEENAFGPQSHGVGLSSEGCLNSWRNSAPQGP